MQVNLFLIITPAAGANRNFKLLGINIGIGANGAKPDKLRVE
jgi:hypothetical protein